MDAADRPGRGTAPAPDRRDRAATGAPATRRRRVGAGRAASVRGRRQSAAAAHPQPARPGLADRPRRGSACAAVIVVWAVRRRPTATASWSCRRRRPRGPRFDGCGRDGVAAGRPVGVAAARRCIGYGISVAIGVVFGVAIGTFASVEAFFEAADRVPALHPGHRADAGVPAVARHRREPEDLADRRRHRVLQHPDDRRRRPGGAAASCSTRRTRSGAGRVTDVRRVILPPLACRGSSTSPGSTSPPPG